MSSRTSALIAPLLLFFWLAGELRDEAAVGRTSAGTASVSLRDGESEPDTLREVRWRDGSLRVMRDWTVR